MVRPTIRQVEVFDAVMRTGSFTAAGTALGITQPGISRTIAEVEANVGFALFARRGRGVVPTHEAVLLHRSVATLNAGLDRVETAARAIASAMTGRLRVATLPALSETFVARRLGAFLRNRPDARVDLETVGQVELLTRLKEGAFDLGICEVPLVDPNLVWAELFVTRAVLVWSRDHMGGTAPVTTDGVVDLAAVDGMPFCRLPLDSPFATHIDAALARIGATPRVVLTARTQAALLAAVREGAGCAIVDPALLATSPGSPLVAYPAQPAIEWRNGLVRRRADEESLLAQAFGRAIRASE